MRTVYYYKVTEFVTTFEADPNKNKPFENERDFKGSDLRKCREEAIEWYHSRIKGFENEGKYFLPFAPPADFELGKNSAYSLVLSLVECIGEEEFEHPLAGEDEETVQESLGTEKEILCHLELEY